MNREIQSNRAMAKRDEPILKGIRVAGDSTDLQTLSPVFRDAPEQNVTGHLF
jgi:hypothetical protein